VLSGKSLATFQTKVVHTHFWAMLSRVQWLDSSIYRCGSLKYRDKTSLHPTIPLQSSKNSSTILRVDPAEIGYVKFIAPAISAC